jgi:hypothetical protein
VVPGGLSAILPYAVCSPVNDALIAWSPEPCAAVVFTA